MQLAKSIMLKGRLCFSLFIFLTAASSAVAQDNSPYSRYGLGNEFSGTNITSRGMGGVSAAYADPFSVNFANPASYSRFQALIEQRSKKMATGRVVLDVGMNIGSRKLTAPNTTKTFTSSDALFSHVYVGLPIKKNWGLSFGIRPLSRISYNLTKNERLRNPLTNAPIDSVITQFTGSGGSFLPSIGTGFGSDNFSVGLNVGYLFGKKELNTHRIFINDTVEYAAANFTQNTSFGSLFYNAGAQYKIQLNKQNVLRLGVAGNWKQTINGTQDLLRQTYTHDASGGEVRIDSVMQLDGAEGKIIYPASYTAGILYENAGGDKKRGWSFGVDYNTSKWQEYRFFGNTDSVQNNWGIHVGTQLSALDKPARYGQAVSYRFGFFAGRDYIRVKNNMPVFGVTVGMGLPIINYNRLSPYQFSMLNLALEYGRRGNDNNALKENIFRISAGLNFTDLWFRKHKYE
ncbi:MAG: hypothetical protein ACM3VS_03095 [Candidatus Dadabacteria bacterium]